MEAQLLEFATRHLFLVAGFAGVTILLLWSLLGAGLGGVQALVPQQAALLINHEDAVILDVREDSEYTQGHILNAIHIPLGALSGKIDKLNKYRDRPIIASCMTGSRSSSACSTLKKNGFENLYNLKGGVMAWQNANLPLVKGK